MLQVFQITKAHFWGCHEESRAWNHRHRSADRDACSGGRHGAQGAAATAAADLGRVVCGHKWRRWLGTKQLVVSCRSVLHKRCRSRLFDQPNRRFVGGHFGYNAQWGQWVVGAEFDGDWMGLSQTLVGPVTPVYPFDTYTTKLYDLETLTLRVGYAPGNWLWYGKGGIATGTVNLNVISERRSRSRFFEHPETVGPNGGRRCRICSHRTLSSAWNTDLRSRLSSADYGPFS